MLASRKRGAALAFLDNLLREGEQPAGIVGALAWMYRKLIEARDLPAHTNGFQAARQLGMRPEAAETAVRQAHRIPKKDLLAGLAALAEADSQLKSANPNPRAMMEFLIARLTSSAACISPARFPIAPKTKGAPNLGAPLRKIADLKNYFFALIAFNANASRDLYRFAVFSERVRLRIALSSSECVSETSLAAPAASAAPSAARIRRIAVRTRVRFMRLTAARRSVWRIFFNTDFVFFLCLTGLP